MPGAAVPDLAPDVEGDVLVLDHVPVGVATSASALQCSGERGRNALNLAAHGEEEEDEEVHDQNGPVHGHVEHLEERAHDRDQRRTCRGQPVRRKLAHTSTGTTAARWRRTRTATRAGGGRTGGTRRRARRGGARALRRPLRSRPRGGHLGVRGRSGVGGRRGRG